MRKLFFIYAALWLVLIVLSPNPPAAWATRPTVTVTLTQTTTRYKLYTATVHVTPQTTGSLDTLVINDPNGDPFSIDGVGYKDSIVTVEMYATKTVTAQTLPQDSTRLGVYWQVATTATSTLPTINQFSTAYFDSSGWSSRGIGSNASGVARFYIRRYGGNATRLRIVFYELNASRDAAADIVFRILIPRN